MKIIKIVILLSFVICHYKLTANQHIVDSTNIDSTFVQYFYNNFDNYTLGNVTNYDTTTLLASYSSPIDKKYSLYQTLSNSGLANRNIGCLAKSGF